MKQFSIIIALSIFAFIAQNAFAHGDHKKEPAPIQALEEPVDSIYITEQ